jgi:Omp85 superfamily domain
MRKWLRILAFIVLVLPLAAGRTRANVLSFNPQDWSLPQSWTSPIFHPSQWPFSLFPVPEIATDPNSGTTIGILPVFMFTDDHQQIKTIVAPDVAFNTILGASGNFRYLSYPSSDTQYYLMGGGSQNIARRVDVYYSTGRDRDKWWSFEGRLFFEKDPTERFYGLGNASAQGNETNYTTEQLYFRGTLGINFTHQIQLALTEQPWYVRIQDGALDNLPFIGNRFPGLKGLGGGSEMVSQAVASYDTRDSVDIPQKGGLYRVFYGVADRAFLSSNSYNQVGFELRHYQPVTSRVTVAARVYSQYTPAGIETPFWAMARLGGDDSVLFGQQTLRGYGAGRYVQNNLTDFNLEIRTRVYERTIMGTHGILELAPFIDAGKVFEYADQNPITPLHPVGGLGFRGIAEPFVVGYVDIGWGGEGPAFFSGINYPF